MGNYSNRVDLAFTDDGDFVVDASGDFDIAEGNDCLVDDINIRLNTNNPDWYHHQWIGATLDDLLGEPNTRANGQLGYDKIVNCLTADGVVSMDDLEVNMIPVSTDEILYYLIINCDEEGEVRIPFTFRFNK
jgi:hypothetical protein